MSNIRLLFVADLCGKPGRQALAHLLRPLRQELNVDFVVANVENAAGGFGVTPEMSRKIFSYQVDVQTSGNHIWDRMPIIDFIESERRLLRPGNFPGNVPGSGHYLAPCGDYKVGVINLMGRTYMKDLDCPFQVAAKLVDEIRKQTPIIFVDFHAEATSEKQALAHFLDGRVSAVVGTHTHVQTADESVSKGGTAYLTDAGMTGPHDSIIGMEKAPSLGRFLTGMPKRMSTATDDIRLSAVLIEINPENGRAVSISRLQRKFNLADFQPDASYGED
jgi:hypothetical protein